MDVDGEATPKATAPASEEPSTSSFETSAPQPSASHSSEPSQIYPDLTADKEADEKEVRDRINHTLQQLLTLGYNNEDDWLLQLVRAKNGDINKVLDVLSPKQQI